MEPGRGNFQKLPATPDLCPADPQRSRGARTSAFRQRRSEPQWRRDDHGWRRQFTEAGRYKRLVVLMTVMGMAAGVAGTRFMPPVEMAYLQVGALVFLGCLGLLILAAVLRDRTDRKVTSPDDVRDELGLTLLGTVPRVSVGDPQSGGQETGEVGEAFRVVRRNLMHVHGKAVPALLAVTSPSAEEGKSFVSANLAREFAGRGRRTLLIDADLSRRNDQRLNGGRRVPGLSECLTGRAALEQVIQPASHRAFDRIGPGAPAPNGSKLVQSRAMAGLLDELRSSYDVILMDTSPLDDGPDPVALAKLAGNLVVVFRAGATDRQLAMEQLERLDRLPINLLGGVLNGVRHNGTRRRPRREPSGDETWDRAQIKVWQHVQEAESAGVDDVTSETPRPGKVYQPNGSSGIRNAEPKGPTEPPAPRPPVKANGGTTAPKAEEQTQQPHQGDLPFSLDTPTLKPECSEGKGGNGGSGGNGRDGESELVQQRRRAQQRLIERRKGDTRQNGDPHPNGHESGNGARHGERLDAYAAAQVEKFREHQRRHHQRLWK